jgi:2-phosphosulfolactate phosphatase
MAACGQTGYGVRFDWGPVGAGNVAEPEGLQVIVDVLSFTTTVTIAVEQGATVYPAPRGGECAARRARELGAELAVARAEVSREHPWSLSPARLLRVPAPARLLLPSPNGSAIAATAEGVVVAASLRNASAVARWLAQHSERSKQPISVIAAGERWPDGSLRPALEDLLGAGAVIAALPSTMSASLSPEAQATRALFEATTNREELIRACASAVELVEAGFADDVDVAAQVDASDVVPLLTDGAFIRAT